MALGRAGKSWWIYWFCVLNTSKEFYSLGFGFGWLSERWASQMPECRPSGSVDCIYSEAPGICSQDREPSWSSSFWQCFDFCMFFLFSAALCFWFCFKKWMAVCLRMIRPRKEMKKGEDDAATIGMRQVCDNMFSWQFMPLEKTQDCVTLDTSKVCQGIT